jgi:hypothetical protein
VDLTARGLTAHLQQIVLDEIIEEQMDTFHLRLTAPLEYPVKRITLGHITTVQDVLKLRDELVVRIDVEMHGTADESL